MMVWDLASVAAKFCYLAALAVAGGGLFCLFLTARSLPRFRRWLLTYVAGGAAVGIAATAGYFLIQVGAINQSGLAGILDPVLVPILMQSGLGDAAMLRMTGFAGILVVTAVLWFRNVNDGPGIRTEWLPFTLLVAGCVLAALSFPLTGHVATLTLPAKLAIVLHVLGMALWIGSLPPLWHFCGSAGVADLQPVMRRFGELAVWFVGLLVLAGGLMLWQLLDSPTQLVTTVYGRALLLKLTGVTGLLTLGALNKLYLVPGLGKAGGVAALKRSISVETAVAVAVLGVTAYLTTLVGIDHNG